MILSLLLSLLLSPVEGLADYHELELSTDYKLASEPLTTEKVWSLDPHQMNPHLQRWMLNRKIRMKGLKSTEQKNGKWKFQIQGIQSDTEGMIRGPGVWYRPFSDFTCEKSPDSWFATEDGTKVAVAAASEVWSDLLKTEKVKLSLLLDRVAENSEAEALERANTIFDTWVKNVFKEWQSKAFEKARKDEWKYYFDAVSIHGKCPKKKVIPPLRRDLMEPLSGIPTVPSQLLARAPVRFWNGLFSVRVSVGIHGKTLNGRFLIDSELNKSVISPDWLESQGVYAAWTTVPNVMPQRVSWGALRNSESHLARLAEVDKVEVGGLTLPLKEFLIVETDFFGPPENVSECCDGVLGRDFLRLNPVEFDPNTPAELRIWPSKQFQWASDTPWVEVSETSSGGVVSSCMTQPSDKKKVLLPGVDWATGSEDAILIHSPWKSSTQKISPNSWDIFCNPFEFAKGVPATEFDANSDDSKQDSLLLKVPAVTIGMPLLSRGKFTFDLPHGRIWFSKETFTKKNPRKNRSGLELDYVMKGNDRVLKVVKIAPKSNAQDLAKAGLKVGMTIVQLDGRNSEEMDLWEVEKKLAGEYGEQLTLQWQTKQGLRMAPLRVR